MQAILDNPSGLVLVTGATATGKTTTLYACLQYLNKGTRKINTLEDPVEYVVPGLRQSQVNPKVGLDFPELLRNILRQSPDVIMVAKFATRKRPRLPSAPPTAERSSCRRFTRRSRPAPSRACWP